MRDLAVITVSHNSARWLSRCLSTVYEHAGGIDLEVLVADAESSDGTGELVAREFPDARVIRCRNGGFGYANNRAILAGEARFFLFLNPDTEILAGTFEELIAVLDAQPEVGLLGVKQVTPEGEIYPTIRRFPNALRALGECIGSERLPGMLRRLGPRLLDLSAYERVVECDWVTGSYMLVRAEALLGAGLFDERFFLSAEEVDLAYRIKQAGWRVVHVPTMTILHHVHMGEPLSDRTEAQYAFARRQYAEKHFSPVHRALYVSLLRARHRLRLLRTARPGKSRFRADADRWALRVLRGSGSPPFAKPPATAITSLSEDCADTPAQDDSPPGRQRPPTS